MVMASDRKKILLPDFLYTSPRAVTALLRRGGGGGGGGGGRSRAADSRRNHDLQLPAHHDHHELLLRSGSKYTTTTTITTTAVDRVFQFFVQGLRAFNSFSGNISSCWDGGGSSAMGNKKFMIPAANEPGKIPMYSAEFYAACTAGGILSCGITHTLVTPMDVVKCNMQIDPGKFRTIGGSFKMIWAEQGAKGLYKGWGPTIVGYSLQGACKFGLYEFFKKFYSDLAGEPFGTDYKTLVYLAGAASAEFVADIALCPFEAVKVRVQTKPGYAKGLTDGMSKFIAAEGFGGLYAGIVPLWGRQIPYTMTKFSIFEKTVEALYTNVVPVPKEQCSKSTQLGVSFAAGYIAGILCAIVSHPADNLVSYLNNKKGARIGQAISDLGIVALFTRGLPLRIVMIGTLTGAQWGIYDAFKVFVGLPTTGGAAPAHGGSGDHGRDTSKKKY